MGHSDDPGDGGGHGRGTRGCGGNMLVAGAQPQAGSWVSRNVRALVNMVAAARASRARARAHQD